MTTRPTLPPERDFPAERLELRRQQLAALIDAEHQPKRRDPLPHQRRRWPLALAGTAAAAIAIAALLPAGGGGPSAAAAAALRHAASTAARQPAVDPPSPGQFVYTESEGAGENATAPAGGRAFNVYQRYTRQAWIGPDGSGRILQHEGPARFVTRADRAAWIADGKPNLNDGGGNINSTFRAGQLSYVDLSKLPTDPAQLKQQIDNRTIEAGPPGEGETFTIIGDLLRETSAPPGVRSALYTIASELPGIQLLGKTRDQLGRSGTGVAYVSKGFSHQLIFDPQTSALLAEQSVLVDRSRAFPFRPGTVLDWTAYLSSGVVDSTSATVSATP